MGQGKYHQRLVHIGRSRAHQRIGPGKDHVNIALPRLLVQHGKFHIISYQGLDLPIAEHALGLTLINPVLTIVYIVKTGNSLNDLTCHTLLLSHREKCNRIGRYYC